MWTLNRRGNQGNYLDHHWEKAVRGQHYQERQGAITDTLPEDKWVVSYKFLQNLTGSACKSLPLTL